MVAGVGGRRLARVAAVVLVLISVVAFVEVGVFEIVFLGISLIGFWLV